MTEWRMGWYDIDGKPLSSETAMQLKYGEDGAVSEYSRIGFDQLDNGVTVSTVWLGLDHGFGSEKPMIFETMIFGGELHSECVRYSDKNDALAGHQRVVEALRNGDLPW